MWCNSRCGSNAEDNTGAYTSITMSDIIADCQSLKLLCAMRPETHHH